MEINGFPNYLIYEDGKVFNQKTQKWRKAATNNHGYNNIVLCKNGKSKTFYIHRLIALHYIPNPENKKEVDHIDRDRLNNHISNLRWATHSENNRNISFQKNNKSGHTYISYCNERNQYMFSRMINGKHIFKRFKTKTDALCCKYIMLLKIKALSIV